MIYTAPMKLSILKDFRVFLLIFSLSLSFSPVIDWCYIIINLWKLIYNLKLLRIFFHYLFCFYCPRLNRVFSQRQKSFFICFNSY